MSQAAMAAAARDALQTTFAVNNVPLTADSCEVGFDGQPKPGCGEYFLSVHPLSWGGISGDFDLGEEYMLGVTLTMRIANMPQDRWGLAVWLGEPNGLEARARQAITALHQSQAVRLAANAYLNGVGGPGANATVGNGPGAGEILTPLYFLRAETPQPRGPDWFSAPPPQTESDVAECGVSQTLIFGKCQRVQGVPSVQQLLDME